MNKKLKTYAAYVSSLIVIFIFWIILARVTDSQLIFPGPKLVFTQIVEYCKTALFWKNFLSTFLRCIYSFIITVVFGFLIGLLCGYSKFARDFFSIPIAIIRTTPVVALILIAVFWFKSGFVPVFVSILMCLPIMITSVQTGIMNANKSLLKMAKIYNFSENQKFKYIILPGTVPFILDGCVSTFGLTWKVVAAGEILSLPKYGAGTMLQKSQVHLNTEQTIAITLLLIIVSFVLEKLAGLFIKSRGKDA